VVERRQFDQFDRHPVVKSMNAQMINLCAQVAHEGIAAARHDKGKGIGLTPGQGRGGKITLIVQLGHGGLDPANGGVANARSTVDHPINSREADASLLRHMLRRCPDRLALICADPAPDHEVRQSEITLFGNAGRISTA
jgi:hypothetical protein